jgi:hypothetical protein
MPSRSLPTRIEEVCLGYHDHQLMACINDEKELDRLNRHRGESTDMYTFNRMIVKALYMRNWSDRGVYAGRG